MAAVSLHRDTGWMVDTAGRLWFALGVSATHPFGKGGRWWQATTAIGAGLIKSSRGLVGAGFVVDVSDGGVWLGAGNRLSFCRGRLSGHRLKNWLRRDYRGVDDFRSVTAAALFDEALDFVWAIRKKGELMAFQPRQRKLHSVTWPSPTEPSRVAATSGVVWVLDSRGQIFVRNGIDPAVTPLGLDWKQLDSSQLGDVQLRDVACSLDCVWSCDDAGGIYARLGTQASMPGGLPPAWLPMDTVRRPGRT